LRMTQIANIADNMTESQKNAWKLLISELSKYNNQLKDYSYSSTAALLYLFKKNAMSFKFSKRYKNKRRELANIVGDFMDVVGSGVFFRVDTDIISKQVAEGLGVSRIDAYKTLYFCISLPESDSLYRTVYNSLSELSYGRVPKVAIEFLSDLISGKKDISESCDFFDVVIQNSGHAALYLDSPVEFFELASHIVNYNGKNVLGLFQNGFIPFAKTVSEYKSFMGIGINSDLCNFISLYLSLCDRDLPLEYISPDELLEREVGRFDVVIANPQIYKINSNGKSIDLGTLAMEKFDSMTNDDGVLFTFVPTRVLFDAFSIRDLRQKLIEEDFLDAVILLPQRLLYGTGIPLALLVLKKGRQVGGKIRMVDASKMSIKLNSKIVDGLDVDAVYEAYLHDGENSISVDKDEIAENFFSFDVPLYIYAHVQAAISEYREGFDILSLSEILVPVLTEKKFDDTEGRIVRIKDIPMEWTDNEIEIERLEMSDDLSETKKLTCPALLMNTVGDRIRIAWCDASKVHPIFLNSYVNAYSLKYENISINYLAMELGKKKDIPVSGSSFPRISHETLKLVRIDFPPLNDSDSNSRQNALVSEGKSTYLLGKAKEMGLQEIIDRMKEEYIKEVRMRRHDMKPYLRQIRSCSELLRCSEELSAEDEIILDSLDSAIDALAASLDRLTQEDKFGTPKSTSLTEYFRHFLDTHISTDSQYSLEVLIDGEDLSESAVKAPEEDMIIYIAPEDLDDLVQNLVSNAKTHGFVDHDREDYMLRISLSADWERDMAVIEFWNNGKPFPKGMTKERYGLLSEKAGKTAGTGIGGYRIKNIVEHYGGDFEISDPEATPVFVRIYLPIYRG
ncbi:MAG: N-6 DNA methylase, partial [Clostridia bacterium]|nr:N-6 DNA methylase [Clostridia bacterium]